MLHGSWLIMPAYFLGRSRACIKYHAALSFWRRVFITEAFRTRRPTLVRMMEALCSKADSRWQLLPSLDDFNVEAEAARRLRKAGQVVLLRGSREVVHGALAGCKQMDFTMFEASINKGDATATVTR